MENNNWVRGAMLLAVGLVLQALRVVIPMPPMWTVFVVGTLVNMVLVLSARTRWAVACDADSGTAAGDGLFSRSAAVAFFDPGRGCR